MIYRSRLDVLFCAPSLTGLHFIDLLNREVHKKKVPRGVPRAGAALEVRRRYPRLIS